MRLINVKTLQVDEFFGDAIPRYAILSHTWGDEEVTFHDMQRLHEYRLRLSEPLKGLGSARKRRFNKSILSSRNLWRLYMIRSAKQKGVRFQGRHHMPQRKLAHQQRRRSTPFHSDERAHHQVEHKRGFDKIKKTCMQAKEDGYGYAWVDTCCIDNTSSAELSEAINSMFAWYKRSARCYVYLADVRTDPHLLSLPDVPNSAYDTDSGDDSFDGSDYFDDISVPATFSTSRWFTRGWTLQELIAPSDVIFYSAEWNKIGNKTSLAYRIHKITRIDEEVLIDSANLYATSVAQRMSWASGRMTTRVEDRAYSLLGMFGINLPLLYGEDGNAFFRLQEEILRTSTDCSLFAWGTLVSPTEETIQISMSGSRGQPRGMFATSPNDFQYSHNIVQDDLQDGLEMNLVKGSLQVKLHLWRFFGSQWAVLPCRFRNNLSSVIALRVEHLPERDENRKYARFRDHLCSVRRFSLGEPHFQSIRIAPKLIEHRVYQTRHFLPPVQAIWLRNMCYGLRIERASASFNLVDIVYQRTGTPRIADMSMIWTSAVSDGGILRFPMTSPDKPHFINIEMHDRAFDSRHFLRFCQYKEEFSVCRIEEHEWGTAIDMRDHFSRGECFSGYGSKFASENLRFVCAGSRNLSVKEEGSLQTQINTCVLRITRE